MVVSWHKLDSTAKKTYPRVSSDKLIDEKCAHYYTHKILSKTLNFGKKRVGLITFSPRK